MLVASPKVEVKTTQKIAKDIVFVLDKSGSMTGKKMEQSKSALKFVMRNLNEGDYFNIITYNDRVEAYEDNLIKFSNKTLEEALKYVETISAGGGTNIDEALTMALKHTPEKNRPQYIIFLTDGRATSGVTDENTICLNLDKHNIHAARIFSFGVGTNVNARLLDRLSSNHGGITEYVKPTEDVEISVSDLYKHISNPVMTDLELVFEGVKPRDIYPTRLPDLFQGSQLIIYGRYQSPGKGKIQLKGKINGVEKVFEFSVVYEDERVENKHDYVGKLWASNRIAFILTQMDQSGTDEEMITELVKLSKKYGIITPYTSFLAQEHTDLTNTQALRFESSKDLKKLETTSGASANEIRAYKNKLKMSPTENDNWTADDMLSEESVHHKMKVIGVKTFYFKENYWLDGDISTPLDKSQSIETFTTAYFEFVAKHPEISQYLKLSGNIYILIEEKVYFIRNVK